MDTARNDHSTVIRRLNPQALRDMGSYFGPLDPEILPGTRPISFWEFLADFNPLGKFGASSAGSIIREVLDRKRT